MGLTGPLTKAISHLHSTLDAADGDFRNENSCFADNLERLHDICMVWTSQIRRRKLIDTAHHPYQLGNRVLRVLLPGARQPYRLCPLLRHPAKNHSRSDLTERIRAVRHLRDGGENKMELRGSIRPDGAGGLLRRGYGLIAPAIQLLFEIHSKRSRSGLS